jgi:hypothetical protein
LQTPGRDLTRKGAVQWTAIGAALSECLVFLFLGLIPLLWFRHNQLITGGDIDFPLHPLARLHERLFAWNPHFLGGTDRSLDVSTLFFVFVQAAGYWLTHDLVTSEKLSFIFWFSASGFSMAIMLGVLFPDRRVLRITGAAFYMFSFYQFYNWEIARIGELSATVALPLFVAALTIAAERKSYVRPVLGLALAASVVAMGVGVQPPELYAGGLLLVSYWLFEVSSALFRRDRSAMKRTIGGGALCAATFVGINSLWILPEANFILTANYLNTSNALHVFAVDRLLEWTSGYTSILHNFSLLGRVVYYDTWDGEPYPTLYWALHQPWFQAMSVLTPLAAFLSLGWNRERRTWFFASVALVTLFLSKGVHPPFAFVYGFLITHVPGMWVLRAPWEKFGLTTAIAYSALIGLSCESVALRLSTVCLNRMLIPVWAGLCVLCAASLDYPLVIGGTFPSAHGKNHFYPGFHQTIPRYVWDAARWVDSLPGEQRILMLPDSHVSIYRWGYAAPADITTRLFDASVIDRQYGEGTAPPHPAFQAYDELMNAIYTGDERTAAELLRYFGITYVLQRDDIRYDFYGGTDSPRFIHDRLQRIYDLRLDRRFGAWEFYRVVDAEPHAYAAPRVILTPSDLWTLGASADTLPRDAAVVTDGLHVGPIASSLEDVSKYIPLVLPNPMSRIDDIAAHGPIERATYPMIAGAQALLSAQYFAGWKAVVGPPSDDPSDTIIATAHSPYRFLHGARNWNAFNSTLVFIQTFSKPLRITGFREDGRVVTDLVGVVWQKGWRGMATKPLDLPLTIPPHERAIAQINHRVTGSLFLLGTNGAYPIQVNQGGAAATPIGFQDVQEGTLKFRVPVTTVYGLHLCAASAPPGLVLKLDGIAHYARLIGRCNRSWWRYVAPSVTLRAGEHLLAVPQLRVLHAAASFSLTRDLATPPGDATLTRPSPVRADVDVNCAGPCLLVFGDNYNPGWRLYEGHESPLALLFGSGNSRSPILVNGFANGWLLDPHGKKSYTLFFWPETLLITGFAVSLCTVVMAASVLCWPRFVRRLGFHGSQPPEGVTIDATAD